MKLRLFAMVFVKRTNPGPDSQHFILDSPIPQFEIFLHKYFRYIPDAIPSLSLLPCITYQIWLMHSSGHQNGAFSGYDFGLSVWGFKT